LVSSKCKAGDKEDGKRHDLLTQGCAFSGRKEKKDALPLKAMRLRRISAPEKKEDAGHSGAGG
jgi:hypothetical protein